MTNKSCAIVLAAGQGKRMQSSVQKQYLLLQEKPVLWYSLQKFQETPWIDDIILVVGQGEESYCREEFEEKYGFDKICKIVPGGKERYESVACGLEATMKTGSTYQYVYIHDGARPFINREMLARAKKTVEQYGAVVVGMPSKDTVKIADEKGKVAYSPNRNHVWMVQTPQVFRYDWIREAYQLLKTQGDTDITDDAMVLERYTGHSVYFVEGSYKNIKITTPEDLLIANAFLCENE